MTSVSDVLARAIHEAYESGYALGVEESAEICDRCSSPKPGLKGANYHMHIGAVTTAAVLATTIRALLPAPGAGVK